MWKRCARESLNIVTELPMRLFGLAGTNPCFGVCPLNLLEISEEIHNIELLTITHTSHTHIYNIYVTYYYILHIMLNYAIRTHSFKCCLRIALCRVY